MISLGISARPSGATAGARSGGGRALWTVLSLVLTVVALLVLCLEAGLIKGVADLAADPQVTDGRLLAMPGTLPHSVGRLLVLLVIQALHV